MATLLKSCVLTCSGCRDYIHVMDLAEGHVAALKQILDPTFKGLKIYNLGRYLFKSGGGIAFGLLRIVIVSIYSNKS